VTLNEIVKHFENMVINHGKEPSAVKLLLMALLDMSATEIYTNMEKEIADEDFLKLSNWIDEYIFNHVPVSHLIGYSYFYGYKFHVNKHVLTPRRETEELVQYVIEMIDEYYDKRSLDVLDIGTGSGCIAITLDKETNARVDALDISEEALNVASMNNETLSAGVSFYQSDMLKDMMHKKYDIIVSNPPYIPSEEDVAIDVDLHEPDVALYGDKDGLRFYKEILYHVKPFLKENYIIAFEHAYNTSDKMKSLIQSIFDDVQIVQIKDMQGLDRFTFIVHQIS
jgi:release factor glutamine methyltransferase